MSRWRSGDWVPNGPKKPPPEHGIRMKKAGTTWWGQRWLQALEHVLGADAGRLARGRTYARAGRAHDLVVEPGRVTAQVTGSRPAPYEVVIQLEPLSEEAWSAAIEGMAKKAQFSAELLAGQMPQAIDEVFHALDVSLFPRRRADLRTSCSCPDWGDPCKHVAATYYVLGEALDRDPFLLFELRGKDKSRVTAALRGARGATAETASEDAAPTEIPSVQLGELQPEDYDKPRQALPALHFEFEAPTTHGAVLRQLGAPGAWSSDASPVEVFAPLVRAAAETARRLAMAEAAPPEALPAPTRPSPKPAGKRRRR
jgi:uncharacterized Zn finger protein